MFFFKKKENDAKTEKPNNPRQLFAGALDQNDPFKASNSSKTMDEWSSLKALQVEIKTDENTFPVGVNS